MVLYAHPVHLILENKNNVHPVSKNPIMSQIEHCLTAARKPFVQIATIELCRFAPDAIDRPNHMNSSMAKIYVKHALLKKTESANNANCHSRQAEAQYAESVHMTTF